MVGSVQDHFIGFDHVHFWVGNALQAASFYITRLGFVPLVYRSLETGSRDLMTQVVKQNDIIFAFTSSLIPSHSQLSPRLAKCGDGVRDVAFEVDDCQEVFRMAVENGARVIEPVQKLQDADGVVVTATIEAGYEGTWHTFVERKNYRGAFLPGYAPLPNADKDPMITAFPPPNLGFIDHCVSNQPDLEMERVVQWYERVLGFHRFWSIDDKQLHTEYSSLRSIVVSSANEKIKMPINEPAEGRRKSQIQEYVDYFDGPGIQHIALNTPDVLAAVSNLKARGVACITVPDTYYEDLKKRLAASSVVIHENIDEIQKLGILVDFDDSGYLLQIFTKPLQDRPTLFLEFIQRRNFAGFGAGNFKSLFEAIERDQALRGNL